VVFPFFLLGVPLYAKDYPKRIVSLNPSVTEELYLLGAEDKIVGCTIYCTRPPEARYKQKVGTVVNVNVEKLLMLKPEVVFATPLIDVRDLKKMRKMGLRVVIFPEPKNFEEICEQFLTLARFIGNEKKAKELIQKAKAQVNAVKEKLKGCKKVKVFVEIGASPLFTITATSFINNLIELAGGINIAKDAASGLYSKEEVVRRNPDVIIIVSMGIAEKEKESWHKLRCINAVKNKRIYFMDAYELCSPTPLSFAQMLKMMVNILHPECKIENKNP